ncbi:MAG: hypothetical protein RL757_3165 [Bacteroidota bacterium]|jgi:hypothetical protein
MIVQPFSGNAIWTDDFNGTTVTIPAKSSRVVMVFLCVWLCFWAIGFLGVSSALVFGVYSFFMGTLENQAYFVGIFLLIWLTGWTAGGYFAFKYLIWLLRGKEVITIENGFLSIQKKGSIGDKKKTYDLNEATGFRVTPKVDMGYYRSKNINVLQSGIIAFDYGMKTINFGENIDEAEAKFILKKYQEKGLLKEKNF